MWDADSRDKHTLRKRNYVTWLFFTLPHNNQDKIYIIEQFEYTWAANYVCMCIYLLPRFLHSSQINN
jgi:hypothetical protein